MRQPVVTGDTNLYTDAGRKRLAHFLESILQCAHACERMVHMYAWASICTKPHRRRPIHTFEPPFAESASATQADNLPVCSCRSSSLSRVVFAVRRWYLHLRELERWCSHIRTSNASWEIPPFFGVCIFLSIAYAYVYITYSSIANRNLRINNWWSLRWGLRRAARRAFFECTECCVPWHAWWQSVAAAVPICEERSQNRATCKFGAPRARERAGN